MAILMTFMKINKRGNALVFVHCNLNFEKID
jgi:hypothetical protein